MFIHLLYTHLTVRTAFFSLTLNTMVFVHSTLGWFGTSTCMTVPAGPPPSSVQHSCPQAATLLGHAFVAHHHLHTSQTGLAENFISSTYQIHSAKTYLQEPDLLLHLMIRKA